MKILAMVRIVGLAVGAGLLALGGARLVAHIVSSITGRIIYLADSTEVMVFLGPTFLVLCWPRKGSTA